MLGSIQIRTHCPAEFLLLPMNAHAIIRSLQCRFRLPALLLFCGSAIALPAQADRHPAPIVRMPSAAPRPSGQPGTRPNAVPRGAHLGQWMQQHNSLSPQQQQKALEHEPGFNQLPQQTQQRMMQRLDRLNSMPEQKRDRVISRSEALEQMTPQQRGSVRNAMGQLGALPQDRRRQVARSFRELRNLPPDQRNSVLNSPEYRQQFSDEERGTLGNLLSVGPLLPPNR